MQSPRFLSASERSCPTATGTVSPCKKLVTSSACPARESARSSRRRFETFERFSRLQTSRKAGRVVTPGCCRDLVSCPLTVRRGGNAVTRTTSRRSVAGDAPSPNSERARLLPQVGDRSAKAREESGSCLVDAEHEWGNRHANGGAAARE